MKEAQQMVLQKITPSVESITRATKELTAKIASDVAASVPYVDSTAAVADLKITPFLTAMKMEGYPPKLGRSGCLVPASECSTCRTTGVFTFSGETGEFIMCIYCAIETPESN
jgi:hypothetical protein